MKKVVLIGIGNVGKAFIYSCINDNPSINEIVVIDNNRDRLIGEVLDLKDASIISSSNINIRIGDYKDCASADIVVITAGVNQDKNDTRLDLINKNDKIIKDITLNVVSSGFNGIFVVVTNPLDIMCYLVRKYSNFPSNKIIGTGTLLDTIRLKNLLKNRFNVNSDDINCYVLGEHGDSSFILWSKATLGNLSLKSLISKEDEEIFEMEVRRQAYKIINHKGETSLAIGVCINKIVKAILLDEDKIYPVSSPVDDIYISMPSVINKSGIKGIMSIKMNEEEEKKFEHSKNVIKENIKKIEV